MTSLNFGSLRHVSLGNQVSLDYISVTLRRDVRQQLQLPRSQRLANVTPRVPALDLFLECFVLSGSKRRCEYRGGDGIQSAIESSRLFRIRELW